MKETFYFSHDYNAAEDEKIKRLLYKLGMSGYGIYWRIIETLYQNDGVLLLECERIAYELRAQAEEVKSVIFDFDLFEIASETFSSRSVNRRLNERKSKSQKARKSAEAKWKKHHANAERTQSDGNAIKESKVKESKVNNKSSYEDLESAPTPSQTMTDFCLMVSDKSERYESFIQTISAAKKIPVEKVRGEIDKFVNYWCEKTRDGKKEKWQTEKTFEVQRRLTTWFLNAPRFSGFSNQQNQQPTRIR